MRTALSRLALILLLGTTLPVEALAEKGVALVIGNSAYRQVPALVNPKNDAADIAAKLRAMGLLVVHGEDLDLTAMRAKVREFITSLEKADLAIFFYAGHGLQVDGVNYLAPVDARLASQDDLEFEAMPMDLILPAMERNAKVNLVFLDACRDNPLAKNLAKSMGTRSTAVGRGLAEIGSGVGSLIAFATQPGNLAFDGEGRNSPFTTALLKHLGTPGQGVTDDLILVRRDVLEATAGKQVPWDNSALTGRVVLVPAKLEAGASRIELALVADDPAKAVGPALRDIGDAALTYPIERQVTLPGDIASLAVGIEPTTGLPTLDLTLAEGAVKRINDDPEILGRRLALVLDGRTVLSVAAVHSPLGARISMSGHFTFEEIERLTKAIAPAP